MAFVDREGSPPWATEFFGDLPGDFNVGGWLTHGDLALETKADFLAISEHRLIPARIRGGLGRA